MLRSIKEIKGYKLATKDGQLGRCKDFLFDDHIWTVRYMVADTGKWLPGRKVLIPPFVLGQPEWASQLLPVRLKQEEIESAPRLDEDAPISRVYEKAYHKHFGWPAYWVAMYPGGGGLMPATEYKISVEERAEIQEKLKDSTLRSVEEVTGYHIEAVDGRIGHVEDFILDDEAWTIRYMVVDTGDWLPGRKVLVSPEWISKVDWSENKVFLELSRKSIENSPPYDASQPINPEYEVRLYDYYGRPAGWMKEPA